MNLAFLPAEGRLEILHIVLRVLRGLVPTGSHLVLLVGSICERYHFLVAFRQQSNGGDHTSQEASGECSSGEAEDEDLVVVVVIAHDEPIASDDMMVETGAQSQVYSLSPPSLNPSKQPSVHRVITRCVCPNPSYNTSQVSQGDDGRIRDDRRW